MFSFGVFVGRREQRGRDGVLRLFLLVLWRDLSCECEKEQKVLWDINTVKLMNHMVSNPVKMD